ncbi:MAG: alpha/beta hydrolase family protein [Candidatus Aminicenantales bacterium]
MKFRALFILLILIFIWLGCPYQQKADDIEGIWEGKLRFPGFESRLAIKIKKAAAGGLTAVMLKPDENDDEIPVSKVIIKNGRMHFEIESLSMTFDGEIDRQRKEISGQWQQGRMFQPLTLRRVNKIEKPARPQTPVPPFPYHEKQVSFTNEIGQAVLAGTLTWPKEGRSFPALILISGGGRHDRDYTVARHKPFLVIADYLSRRGIAVLRFDERGVGGSTGDRSKATIEDIVLDVLAGLKFLKSNKYFKVSKIGLLGHSEGGMIAELAAVKSADVSFIIILATPGLPGREYQLQFEETSSRALGMDERQITARLKFQERVFDILLNKADTAKARIKLEKLFGTVKPPLPDNRRKAAIERFISPWFSYNLAFNPAAVLTKIKCPLLAIFGEKDLQVPPERNAAAVKSALQRGENPDYLVVVLPGLNHFFQTNKQNIPFQYGKIEETISPIALELISDCILKH